MSTLTELLRQVAHKDNQLAENLDRELKALQGRRAFGLNFERHQPENVELPGRPVRRGDKVHILPPRDQPKAKADKRLWRAVRIKKAGNKAAAEMSFPVQPQTGVEPETATCALDDLVVVAEFRDPIYPGLISTGKVERGGDAPFHTVINAENFHALQALTYTHTGKVDAIYIDPPYNSRANDWKYNNDYVDPEDAYVHSKWLAMMERRLVLARRLLNPNDSVLICSIDEKEYLRLGLLLNQVFNSEKIEMISSVINPKGTGRSGDFARTNEYLFVVRLGKCRVTARPDMESIGKEVSWETMRRRNLASIRGRKGRGACGPNQFYPIFVDEETGDVVGRGEPLDVNVDRQSVCAPSGQVAVFPVRKDGTEMNWEYTDRTFDIWFRQGYIRANGRKNEPQTYIIQHLPNKARKEIDNGVIEITGHRKDGSVVAAYVDASTKSVTTQWNFTSHSAEHGGTRILKALIPGRPFPYPKSVYAVEDILQLFVGQNKSAEIVDFFSGSGTTAHAVMRLNKQDGGQRQCISITNNEVAASEQAALRKKGLRPGDTDWEQWGICDYITKPRLRAAVTGRTPEGQPIKGDYKFTDEFSMADGFAANVEFFTMTYEARLPVAHNHAFARIAPLLWLKAGAQGRRIDQIADHFAVADCYAILFDVDAGRAFVAALDQAGNIGMVFIVTDDDASFQSVCMELPESVEAVRLYSSYLTNFTLNAGGV